MNKTEIYLRAFADMMRFFSFFDERLPKEECRLLEIKKILGDFKEPLTSLSFWHIISYTT